jgi:hypothetical protein
VSFVTLVLSLVAAVAATAAVALSLVRAPLGGKPGDRSPAEDVNPFAQQGTVKPEGQVAGIVFYPVSYASPPHLTLSPAARYCLARQDELGFTWVDRLRLNDSADLTKEYPDLRRILGEEALARGKAARPQPDTGGQPELAWDSRGVRAGPGAAGPRVFQQTGSFQCFAGGEGEVFFPLPYESPPNVELTSLQGVTVTVCTPLGFAWKSTEKRGRDSQGSEVKWTAKGVRAAPASDRAAVSTVRARAGLMPGGLLRQEGTFAPVGTEGEVYFPHPYASPPNVELFYTYQDQRYPDSSATVGECKATGFKWKVAKVISDPSRLIWVAKGAPASEDRK